ncbi:hypothetical protein G7Z17_g11810 [Cylindrodendrum hubeiense]|uniref:Calponin-homology (CH) domain-containing protein n=1 Tax=Cylindrodendrum hubeiense TaxID=595255 RepID=A0A9P5H0A7_9HYPO|nr:hypothetical protein G7Z17_g11810 [Cylindrodendrum hubeiense]
MHALPPPPPPHIGWAALRHQPTSHQPPRHTSCAAGWWADCSAGPGRYVRRRGERRTQLRNTSSQRLLRGATFSLSHQQSILHCPRLRSILTATKKTAPTATSTLLRQSAQSWDPRVASDSSAFSPRRPAPLATAFHPRLRIAADLSSLSNLSNEQRATSNKPRILPTHPNPSIQLQRPTPCEAIHSSVGYNMASVTSLDKDLRKMRLDRYTPAAANEARSWVEDILGERLSSSDLLDALKDGVALCKLTNLVLPPPGVRFKQSAMPFVQMENISHFLRACQSPPLNLHQHDTFLTVDLYEQKDPAQVLQCLGAFSRAAHAANPQKFPSAIGSRARSDAMSPQGTGPVTPVGSRARGASVTSNSSSAYAAAVPHRTGDSGSGRWSPTKSPQTGAGSPRAVTSWSKREHEGSTAPAWNIAQYGYLGGASQGNLGIAFGGRRQITTAGPHVPNLAEKERRRKEREAEEERLRQEAEEEERLRVAEEERARVEEERRWEEEAQQLREKERYEAEEEKRRWEEEERQWRLTEEKRRKEEDEAEARLAEDRRRTRSRSDAKLRGQFLSQYRVEEAASQDGAADGYRTRVQELEKELELARQRETEYERERQERVQPPQNGDAKPRSRSRAAGRDAKARPRSRSRLASPPSRQDSWSRSDREVLSTKLPHQHDMEQQEPVVMPPKSPRPLPVPTAAQQVRAHHTGSRPLPEPTPAQQVRTHNTGGRPLPDPSAYASKPAAPKPAAPKPAAPKPVAPKPAAPKPTLPSRTDRFLASNPAPASVAPQHTYSRELGATAERDAEDQRRAQSQAKTKAGGWASKSLLEREMEMERQRQQEWEEAQKETAAAVRDGDGVDGIGGGIGGRWDVGQWSGFTGGDGQNKGAQGIGAGRRQIVGPRPLPEPR